MATEVGSAQVSVFPVFKGFRAQVTKETQQSGSEGGKAFANAFKAASATATPNLSKMNAEVRAAAAALSKARITQTDAANKAKLAEQQLTEVTTSGASKIRDAEDRLAAAKRTLATLESKEGVTAAQLATARDKVAASTRAVENAQTQYGASSSRVLAAQQKIEAAQRGVTQANDKVKESSDRLRAAQTNLAGAQSQVATSGQQGANRFAQAWDSVRGKLGASISGAVQAGAQQAQGAATSGGQRLGTGLMDAFRSAVSRASSTIKSAVSSVASTAFSGLQSTATATFATIGTGLGVALSKGFQRLDSIDVAKAKLSGLGNSAKDVDGIMTSALESVRGTAFGLGDAATVAASAVAAGIQPGQQLTGVLKVIANSAAAAGTGMTEMGAIFNQVASKGKADTGDLNQLADRGIPIWQKLADLYGTNVEAVHDMAEKGKIDFADFSKAAEAASGNVASAMGKTFRGSLDNMMAAVGRVGANLLDGVFSKLAPLLQSITTAMGPLEQKAKSVGQVIGNVIGPVIDKVTAAVGNLGKTAGPALSGLTPILGTVGAAFAALGAGGFGGLLSKIPLLGELLPGLGSSLGALGGPVGVAVSALLGLIATVPPLREGVLSILTGIAGALQDFGKSVAGVSAAPLAAMMTSLAQAGKDLGASLGPALAQVRTGFESLMQGAAPGVGQMIKSLADGVTAAAPSLARLGQQLFPAIGKAVTDVGPQLGRIVGQIGSMLAALGPLIPVLAQIGSVLVPAIARVVGGLLGPAFRLVGDIIRDLRPLFDGLVNTVQGALDMIGGLLTGNWSQALEGFKTLGKGQLEVIGGIFTGAFRIIADVVKNTFAQIGNTVGAFFPSVQARVAQGLTTVGATLTNFFTQRVPSFFANLGPTLAAAFTAAGAAIATFFTVTIPGWFTGAFTRIRAFFTSLPGMALTALQLMGQAILTGIGYAIGIIAMLPQMAMALLGALWTWVSTTAQTAWTAFSTAVSTGISSAIAFVAALPGQVMAFLSSLAAQVVSSASAAWSGFSGAVSSGISSAIAWVSGLPGQVMAFLSQVVSDAMSSASSFGSNLASGFAGAVSSAVSAISGLPGQILGVLDSLAGQAFSAAASIGQNIVNGLMSMLGSIGSAASSIMSQIASFLPHSPAAEGPFSGSGWGGWGEAIGDEVAVGLYDRARNQVRRASNALAAAMRPDPDSATLGAGSNPAIAAAGASGAGGVLSVDTPIVLQIDGRALYEATHRVEARWGGRG